MNNASLLLVSAIILITASMIWLVNRDTSEAPKQMVNENTTLLVNG